MANVNKVILIGRITRDIEVRSTPKGTAVAELGMATNRFRQDESGQRIEETTYVDVTLWGKQAELAGQYLAKGREVYIEGRLQLDTWQEKTSGQNRSKLRVVGETMQFIGGQGQGGGQSQGGSQQRPQQGGYQQAPQQQAPQQSYSAPPQQQAPMGGSAANVQIEEEDDIPF